VLVISVSARELKTIASISSVLSNSPIKVICVFVSMESKSAVNERLSASSARYVSSRQTHLLLLLTDGTDGRQVRKTGLSRLIYRGSALEIKGS
jgi:hypothetical protein